MSSESVRQETKSLLPFENAWSGEEGVGHIKGKTVDHIRVVRTVDERISHLELVTACGWCLAIYHRADCCESVDLIDIGGDLNDLVSKWPIEEAEMVSNKDESPQNPDDAEYGSYTWTYVKLGTMDGRVTLRWYGTSNGCYSEEPTCSWFKIGEESE